MNRFCFHVFTIPRSRALLQVLLFTTTHPASSPPSRSLLKLLYSFELLLVYKFPHLLHHPHPCDFNPDYLWRGPAGPREGF